MLVSEFLYILIVFITTVITIAIAYYKWRLTYWNRADIPTLHPVIPFGDTKDLFLSRMTFGQQFRELYQQFKVKKLKHGGIYLGPKPFYMPIDPEMVKNIMQKDFQHFVNHGFYINEEIDPLTGHLFNLEDEKWRTMRTKLTPTFSSSKIKMMFQTLAACAVRLENIMEAAATGNTPVDIKDISGRFTIDNIGSVGFGLDCNCLKNPESEFRKFGKKGVDDWKNKLRLFASFALPRTLLKAIKFKFTSTDVEEFVTKLVRDTVDYREKNNIYRKDFMHLLLQLKNRGSVTEDKKITDENGEIQEKGLTLNELAAQVYAFFLAGFETSSIAMTFALYELSNNLHIQDKLRQEIREVMEKYNNEVTYEAMNEMIYMEKVLQETLRKYPPVNFITRQCTKDYTIQDSIGRLQKGDDVIIPILALHTDAEYYPEPEIFDPDRFSEENKHSRPPFTWIPFGEGPRICIGLRFGMLQIKVGLTTLLKNYRIKLNCRTATPLTMDNNSFLTATENDLWFDVEKLN